MYILIVDSLKLKNMPNYCLNYYVRLSADGFPVVGEMMGFNPKIGAPCDQRCQWALLKTTAYTAPAAMHQCFHPNGLRYFYQLNRQGNILPNSMIATYDFPNSVGGCSYFIEWKKYCNN